MIPVGKLLALALGLLLAQALGRTLSEWIRPDFVLVFALGMGLRRNATPALVLAFAMGFVVDVLSGAPLGLYALLRGTACASTRLFDRALYLRAPAPWAAYVAGYSVADAVLVALVCYFFAPDTVLPAGALLARLPGQALFTAIVAAPLLALFLRLEVDSDREGLRTLRLGSRS